MRLALLLAVLVSALILGCAAERRPLPIDSPYRPLNSLEKGQILHGATGRLLSESEAMDYLASYPVVYVGETHDNVDAHAVQLQVLRTLHERYPEQLALGLEMLRRPSQAQVDAYLAGELDDKAFLKVWQENWGPNSFAYYQDIVEFAREQQIPVLALNAGRDLTRALRADADLDPELTARLPEMDTEDPYHRAQIEGFFGGHEMGSNQIEVFYRSQVLWDETMAQTAAEYLASAPGRGRRLLIFAGGNHVRYGFGIPRRLFRRTALPYVILSPHTVEFPEDKQDKLMDVELPDLPLPAADLYWAVGYEDLEDERVMLGVQIQASPEGEPGVVVMGVMPDSPAARAGIEEGDVILRLDDQSIGELFDLTYQVGQHVPGDVSPVVVRRGAEELTLEVTHDVVSHGQHP